MTDQYQNHLHIGWYKLDEKLSTDGTFTVRVEDTRDGSQVILEKLSMEKFDALLGMLSETPSVGLLNRLEYALKTYAS